MREVERDLLNPFCDRIARVPGMRSLLVSQGDQVLLEEYWNGAAPHLLHDLRSVTKSVLSTLVGIAIEQGQIGGLADPIAKYLAPVVDLDEPVAAITIEDLLTMRAGHAWDVFSDEEFHKFRNATDQLVYVVQRPMTDEPGTRWVYSDGSSHLVSAVLSEATGLTALNFAARHLFGPLGIDHRQMWESDYRGYNLGGVGLAMRTLELNAFARLFLNDGVAEGRPVLPAGWARAATRPHVDGVAEEMPASEDFPAYPVRFSYGYYWWLGRIDGLDFSFAKGLGGQYVIIVPDLDLSIVSTCDRFALDAPQVWKNDGDVLRLIVSGLLMPLADA